MATTTTTAKQEVDTKYLYGNYQKARDWREEYMKQMAYKANNSAPPEDMQITNTKTGIGTLGTVGIAAAASFPGLLAAGILGYALSRDPAPQTTPTVTPPIDSEYEVLFYDKDGKLIDVPRRKAQP